MKLTNYFDDQLHEMRSSEPALQLLPILVKLILPKKARTDNILTKIRLIRGVATVTQVRAIRKADVMHRAIEILVKCHPGSQSDQAFIKELNDNIRAIDHVNMVHARFINDRELARVLNVKSHVTSMRS